VISLPRGAWPVTVVLGLSAFIFAGGLANLAGVAYAPVLDVLFLSGVAYAFVAGVRTRLPRIAGIPRVTAAQAVVAAEILLVMGFVMVTVVPAGVFNFHDDFEKYFAHPVRMLQTGSVAGSPLSVLGSEALGGMALLHAVVLAHFAIPYLPAVDLLFGLLLCLLLVADVALRRGHGPLTAGLLVALVVVVDPQIVNVSASYLASALIAAAILLGCDDRASDGRPGFQGPPSVALGLIYAALIALKPSFAVFIVLHATFAGFSLPAPAEASAGAVLWGRFRWLVRAGLWTVFFTSPWLLPHVPHYLAGGPHTDPVWVTQVSSADIASLLSFKRSNWGDPAAYYTLLAAVPALVVLAYLIAAGKNGRRATGTVWPPLAAATGAVLAGYLLMTLALSPFLFGVGASIRYQIPILIGAVPVILASGKWGIEGRPPVAMTLMRAWPVLLALMVLVLFSGGLIHRMSGMLALRTVLPFWINRPVTAEELTVHRQLIGEEYGTRIAAIQGRVPPGEPIVAWILPAFHLDYARNPVVDAEPAGLTTPWARIPDDSRYFLWQYAGPYVRSKDTHLQMARFAEGAHYRLQGWRSYQLFQTFETMRSRSDVLYDDGQYLLFRVPDTSGG
jgi:hypothetical protein